MLAGRSIAGQRDVQARVGIEKVGWLQHEACVLHWHDRPVLHSRDMCHAKGVPDDAVCVGDGAVLQSKGQDSVESFTPNVPSTCSSFPQPKAVLWGATRPRVSATRPAPLRCRAAMLIMAAGHIQQRIACQPQGPRQWQLEAALVAALAPLWTCRS